MEIQIPFTFWDVLAAMVQAFSAFWAASSPGLRFLICLLIVVGLFVGPQRETSLGHFRRRRRYRNRWDD
jgi:hypothetical protein